MIHIFFKYDINWLWLSALSSRFHVRHETVACSNACTDAWARQGCKELAAACCSALPAVAVIFYHNHVEHRTTDYNTQVADKRLKKCDV
jgi:hypothetical protein